MIKIFQIFSLKYFKRQKTRTLLTMGGICLSVALYISVSIVNKNIFQSFRSVIENIAGKAALQITGSEAGFREEILEIVEGIPGIEKAAPVIEETSSVSKYKESELCVLGIDILKDKDFREYKIVEQEEEITDPLLLLAQPNSILLAKKFADRYNLKVHDELELVTAKGLQKFQIEGLLLPEGPAKTFDGNFIIMDVYSAQIIFGKDRKFDRIDILAKSEASIDRLKESIEKKLGPGFKIERPERRTVQVEKLLESFQLGLSLVSFIAIFVSIFIVYNTVSFSLLQRYKDMGILRAIGATKRQIQFLFILEAAVMGIIASAIGILLGRILAKEVLYMASNSITSVYAKIDVSKISLPFNLGFQGMCLGVGSTILSSYFPSQKALKISPISIIRRHIPAVELESFNKLLIMVTGILLILIATAILYLPFLPHSPYLGYLSSFFILLGFSFLAPIISTFIAKESRKSLQKIFGVESRLASDNLIRSPIRTAVTVAALMIGISQVINISSLVLSYKKSILDWMDETVNAPIFVQGASKISAHFDYQLEESIGEELEKIPEIESVYRFRFLETEHNKSPIAIISMDMKNYLKKVNTIIIKGKALESQLVNQNNILISEPFNRKFNKTVGEQVILETPVGKKSFQIKGIYVDYSTDRPIIKIDRSIYIKYWQDHLVDSFGVYLKNNQEIEKVRKKINSLFSSRYRLMVITNKEYKSGVVKMIDDLFIVIYALEFVTIFIGLLGVINSLLATVITRFREIGILKAMGGLKRQLMKMIMIEGSIIGLIGSLIGIMVGLILSVILVKYITEYSQGWTLRYFFPYYSTMQILIIVSFASLIASYYPARKATEVSVNKAIEYE